MIGTMPWCYYRANDLDHLEWVRGENAVNVASGDEGETILTVTIDSPQFSDGGEYRCRAILTNGTTLETSGGFLNLYRK